MIQPFLPPYKKKNWINKSELGTVLHFVKTQIQAEHDEFKKQVWAEVGLKLNEIYLHLGVANGSYYAPPVKKKKGFPQG